MFDVGMDGLFQFFRRPMHSSPQLLFCQQGKPLFDHVQPTDRGRREVQIKARTLDQPVADQVRLVGSVVVQNQVHIEFRRHILLDGIKGLSKLHGTVARQCFADQFSDFGIENGKQCRCSVAGVVVGSAFNLSWTHWQKKRGSIQRSYLTFLIEAQDQSAFGWCRIQSHSVRHLLDEQWPLDNLKVSARCGASEEAISRVDQCVAACGVDSSVNDSTRSTSLSLSLREVPGRGSSNKPSSPCSMYL